jgi:biopolymer transport protein ExbD
VREECRSQVRATDVGARGGVKSSIDVTALVGVLLVLLTIAMIILPVGYADDHYEPLRLPRAVNTVDKPDPSYVFKDAVTVVLIAADRAMYVNGKPVREEELAARVTESLESKNDKTILIEADQETPYAAIMAAMEGLRAVQIATVSLVVKKMTGPP